MPSRVLSVARIVAGEWRSALLVLLAMIGYLVLPSDAVSLYSKTPRAAFVGLIAVGFLVLSWNFASRVHRIQERHDEAITGLQKEIGRLKTRTLMLMALQQDETMHDILDRKFGPKSRWLLERRRKLQSEYFSQLRDEILSGDYSRASEVSALREIIRVDDMAFTGGGIGGQLPSIDKEIDQLQRHLIREYLVLDPWDLREFAKEMRRFHDGPSA